MGVGSRGTLSVTVVTIDVEFFMLSHITGRKSSRERDLIIPQDPETVKIPDYRRGGCYGDPSYLAKLSVWISLRVIRTHHDQSNNILNQRHSA